MYVEGSDTPPATACPSFAWEEVPHIVALPESLGPVPIRGYILFQAIVPRIA